LLAQFCSKFLSVECHGFHVLLVQYSGVCEKASVVLHCAGYLPNCIETVEAMLSAASIGAIWSAASPDFGVKVSMAPAASALQLLKFGTRSQLFERVQASTLFVAVSRLTISSRPYSLLSTFLLVPQIRLLLTIVRVLLTFFAFIYKH